jgi:hypothetical protein
VQKRELATLRTQEGNVMRISSEIHARLLEVRDQFRLLQQCPCCRSEGVDKQKDATLFSCRECGSQWGRRICRVCRKDYTFIIPHDLDAGAPPDAFDALRMFGADMCAQVLASTSAPFVPNATACPRCDVLPQMKLS